MKKYFSVSKNSYSILHLGNSRKSLWKSPYWIFYHISNSNLKLDQLKIYETDFYREKITSMTYGEFIKKYINKSSFFNEEIQEKFNLRIGLCELLNLYQNSSFNSELEMKVKEYLESKMLI